MKCGVEILGKVCGKPAAAIYTGKRLICQDCIDRYGKIFFASSSCRIVRRITDYDHRYGVGCDWYEI
jgi:hypothetical protein